MAITTTDAKELFPTSQLTPGAQIETNGVTQTVGEDGTLSDPSEDTVDKGVTPPKWDGPEDARKHEGAGTYPNYYAHKTRSGHVLLMDDSKGAENVTLQHRSGSMVQFHPDGKVAITAQNGQYTFTFGENRVQITGAHDVTVEGAASLRVKGDYNMTVGKNVNMTVQGDYNITAKNFNQAIRGNIDIAAKNMTSKTEGSYAVQASGAMQLTSVGSLMVASSTDSAAFCGKTMVSVLSDVGPLMARSGLGMSFHALAGDVSMLATAGRMAITGLTAIVTGETLTTIQALAIDVKAGAAMQVLATGALNMTGASVSIEGVGDLALQGGAASITGESTLGINSPVISASGVIGMNSGTPIAIPTIPAAPVAQVPPIPLNPKLFHIATPRTIPTVEELIDL